MKIIILSDSPMICTGFSNQSRLLAKYLTDKGHEIHYFANAYQGQTLKNVELEDGTKFEYKIYGQNSPYFQAEMGEMIKRINADIFMILLDTFMLYPWFLNVDTSPAKTIFWYPSDGGAGLPVNCENILRKIDRPVAMSMFGKKQVEEYHKIKADYIPHGTEPERFFKMEESQRFVLRAKWGLNDKLVVGVVARNQPRKMLDRTIKAFKLVAQEVPNAILLLHLDPRDNAAGWDMINLIRRYNLENRVRFTGMTAFHGFDWNQMNEVYNLMDVFFLSTSGEGFGIPLIEAMSCEVPIVATDYTTTREIIVRNNCGYAAKLVGTGDISLSTLEGDIPVYDDAVINGTLTGSWQVERGIMDVEDAAEKIIELLNDKELRELMGSNGRKAVMEQYVFNKHVAPKFEKIMEELYK